MSAPRGTAPRVARGGGVHYLEYPPCSVTCCFHINADRPKPVALRKICRIRTSGEGAGRYRLVVHDVFSKPFNFSGVPTLSVPGGFSEEGLPLSVQFVGSPLDEASIFRAAHAFEQATPSHDRHPAVLRIPRRSFSGR